MVVYSKIKNLDNPLIFKGKVYQFIDFKFSESDAKGVADSYSKRYGIVCRLFKIAVKGNVIGKNAGYGVYSTWVTDAKK
jgi:hypothetical protein